LQQQRCISVLKPKTNSPGITRAVGFFRAALAEIGRVMTKQISLAIDAAF
jgi:hypothetical protein